MGGYAFFVWSSFALTAIVMLLTWWSARQRQRSALASARRRATETGS